MSLIIYALVAMLAAYAAIVWIVLARDRRARIRLGKPTPPAPDSVVP